MEGNMSSHPNAKRKPPNAQKPKQVGWRIDTWREGFGGVCRGQVAEWIKTGELPSVKIGGMRVILESPEDFIAKHVAKTASGGKQIEAEVEVDLDRALTGSEQPESKGQPEGDLDRVLASSDQPHSDEQPATASPRRRAADGGRPERDLAGSEQPAAA
jgi:hypothetical protein